MYSHRWDLSSCRYSPPTGSDFVSGNPCLVEYLSQLPRNLRDLLGRDPYSESRGGGCHWRHYSLARDCPPCPWRYSPSTGRSNPAHRSPAEQGRVFPPPWFGLSD